VWTAALSDPRSTVSRHWGARFFNRHDLAGLTGRLRVLHLRPHGPEAVDTEASANLVVGTVTPASLTGAAALKDQKMREDAPIFAGEKRHQIALDLLGSLLSREAESRGKPSDMRVDDDTLVDPEAIPEDDIRRLPRDSAQGE
jgi:hypothetical protein